MAQDGESGASPDGVPSTLPHAPEGGWTLDNIPPDLPKHTELIRGELVVSPQRTWHLLVVRMFEFAMVQQAPKQFVVLREMAVKESGRSAPEPDLSIVYASALEKDQSLYSPRDLVLAAEVVSPESEKRDSQLKPLIYAEMGIPSYWLIERGEGDVPIVQEYRLVAGTYLPIKRHTGRLVTDIPFPIDIPLTVPAR